MPQPTYRSVKPSLPALLLCLLALAGLAGCIQQQTFNYIPRNGYIEHFAASNHERMPFDSYWDISDNKDWDERIRGEHGKSQPIYIKPVTLAYFTDMPTEPGERQAIEELRAYFDHQLGEAMKNLDAGNNTFHLMSAPGKDTYVVEIAILSARPALVAKNILTAAASFVVRGGGLLLGREKDKGSISMGARFYAPNGKLVAEVADYEFGQKSLVGMVLLDTKDFRHYAYQRQTIDQWVDEFSRIFSTIHEQKIRKPWFTLTPF